MNVKRELIALAIRFLAEKTTLVRKPDAYDLFFWSFLGGETYDQKLAREIETESEKAFEAAKRLNTNIKFRRITKNL